MKYFFAKNVHLNEAVERELDSYFHERDGLPFFSDEVRIFAEELNPCNGEKAQEFCEVLHWNAGSDPDWWRPLRK